MTDATAALTRRPAGRLSAAGATSFQNSIRTPTAPINVLALLIVVR